jgi:serine/threonine protein kinase
MGRTEKKADSFDAAPRDLGRYRLHGEIASGGMATVHFGRQLGTGGFAKTVAIKRLHPQFAKMPEFVEMFLAEARLAARIRHPNVVQPLDVLHIDDEIFIVMEYIEGDSLSRLLRATYARKERVPIPIAMTIMTGVLHGLHAAHEAKNDQGEPLELVHRDVSPQNILVGIDGVPRVIDFGIAKAADSVQITRDGELKGKLSYMAPEQINGHRLTRKTDIYAATVVLWEVLTGQRLFDADYQSAVLKNILHRPVDPPSEIVHGLPTELDAIVLKGLARDYSDRWMTARELALVLEETVPLATQSSVGAWVEVVATKSLATRGARVSMIEKLPSSTPELDRIDEVQSEMFIHTASGKTLDNPTPLWKPTPSSGTHPRGAGAPVPSASPSHPSNAGRPASARSLASASGAQASSGSLGRSSAAPAAATERSFVVPPPVPHVHQGAPIDVHAPTVIDVPKVLPKAAVAPPPRSSDAYLGTGLPPPTIKVPDGPVVAPEWPVPGIVPAPAGTLLNELPKKRSSGASMVALLLVMLVGVVSFYFVLPELIKRSYVSAAEREYGATLHIDVVEPQLHQVRLIGVQVNVAEIGAVTLRAKSVDLELREFSPVRMVVHDVTVTADGSYPTLHEAVSGWMSSHSWKGEGADETLARAVIESANILWTRPFGEQTRIEVENATATVERAESRPLGDDLTLDAPIVNVFTAAGKVGPWHARWQEENRASRVNVVFSSGGTLAQCVLGIAKGVVTSVELTVPRMPVSEIGIPLSWIGRRPDEQVFIEGDVEYVLRSPVRVEAHLRGTVGGARLAGAASATDAILEGRIDGDPNQPIEVSNAGFAFAPFRARLTGPVTLSSAFLRAELNYKSAPIKCGGTDQTVNGTVHFDSRNVDGSGITLVPNVKCGLRVLPP